MLRLKRSHVVWQNPLRLYLLPGLLVSSSGMAQVFLPSAAPVQYALSDRPLGGLTLQAVESARNSGETVAEAIPMQVGGQTYLQGFSIPAGSHLTFSLSAPGHCTRFTASVGLDDSAHEREVANFQVLLDGRKVYDSGLLAARQSPALRAVNVDVTGGRQLQLLVRGTGSAENAVTHWINPQLSCLAETGVSLSTTHLDIIHRQKATLNATFTSISGPVTLALEAADESLPGPVELLTTTLNVTGTTAYPLEFTALGLPPGGMYPLTGSFNLIVTQEGRELARTPLGITEKLLKVTTTAEPATLQGRAGGIAEVVITVKVEPPLPAALPIELEQGGCEQFGGCVYLLQPAGATYGDGSVMKRRYRLVLPTADVPPVGTPLNLSYVVKLGDFIGYRRPYYGTNEVQLSWLRQP